MLLNSAKSLPNHNPNVENRSVWVLLALTNSQNSGTTV
jgi:hypothetical protein